MGKLVDEEWVSAPERGHDDHGLDDWIGRSDSDNGIPDYPAESGRFRLYISRPYPWAHRAALTRCLRRLEDVIPVDIVDPVHNDDSWEFTPSKQACIPDSVHGFDYLRDVHTKADSRRTEI